MPLSTFHCRSLHLNHERRVDERLVDATLESCMQIKKQQSEPDTEQQTGSKLGKGILRLYIFTLLI